MNKQSLFLLALLGWLGIAFSALAAADGEDTLGEYGKLSSKKGEEYSTEDGDFKRELDGDEKLEGSWSSALKEFVRTDGQKIKNYYNTYLKDIGDSTNFALVRIFYSLEDGSKYHKEIHYAFLSGMKVDPALPNLKGKNKCLGDYYPEPYMRNVWNKPSEGSLLLNNFIDRGFSKTEKQSKITQRGGREFNAQAFAHSEQAFMSHVMRSTETVGSVSKKPTGIVVMISSTRDTCSNCNKMLKYFLEGTKDKGKKFKGDILKKMFPKLSDDEAKNIPLTVIYVYYLKKREYPPPTEDLLDVVDFVTPKRYIKVRVG